MSGSGDKFRSHSGIEHAADMIRRQSPESFAAMLAALEHVYQREMDGLLRAGGSESVLVSQGRARMIEDILTKFRDHQAVANWQDRGKK